MSPERPHRVDRFAELEPEVQEFLSDLREEDVKLLRRSIDFIKWSDTTSRYVKWGVVTVVAFFLASISLGEGLQKVWMWFSGAPKP